MKLLGPYTHTTGSLAGRKYVIVCNDEGKRVRQTLYSRWLMEQHLGYELPRSVHVHHLNEDFTDDRIENLELKSSSEHSREHSTGRPSPLKGTIKGWTHGGWYAWMTKKCQCDECATARRAWYDQRNKTRREGAGRGPYRKRGEYEHGTRTMYRMGCRCDGCRADNTQRARDLRARKRTDVAKQVTALGSDPSARKGL